MAEKKQVEKTNFFVDMKKMQLEIEKKGTLSYSSWADVWDALKTIYPNAYDVWFENPNGTLGFVDEFGCWAKVAVVIPELKLDTTNNPTWLQIQDFRNKAMKADTITTNDINKAYQRCSVKAVAKLTGLGLYIYRGEDLPSEDVVSEPVKKNPVIEAPKTSEPKKIETKTPVEQAVSDIPSDIVSDEPVVQDTPEQDAADADNIRYTQGCDICDTMMVEIAKKVGPMNITVADVQSVGFALMEKWNCDNKDRVYQKIKEEKLMPFIHNIEKDAKATK